MTASKISIPKSKLLEELAPESAQFHGFESKKMAIFVRCSEDLEISLKSLEDSMNSNATSSNNLAEKLMYLNIILMLATVIGTVLATYKLFNP